MTDIHDKRLSVTSISSRLLHVNENDEIGIKSGTMWGFVVRCEIGEGGEGGVCAWCKRGVHTCVAHRSAFHEVTGGRAKDEGAERGST